MPQPAAGKADIDPPADADPGRQDIPRSPIVGLEYEMDCRRVFDEFVL